MSSRWLRNQASTLKYCIIKNILKNLAEIQYGSQKTQNLTLIWYLLINLKEVSTLTAMGMKGLIVSFPLTVLLAKVLGF
jgi:hypothetical protein